MKTATTTPPGTMLCGVRTLAGERLADQTVTAAEARRTACYPQYWSLFLAADRIADRLGRRDVSVWCIASDPD
jgi:hypothetical protein